MYKTPGLTVSESLGKVRSLRNELTFAEVAELVDALASGASGRKVVRVQVSLSAPLFNKNLKLV